MAVKKYIQLGTQLILRELKAPPKYSNYKQSRQYKEALQDKGIDIKAINAEGIYIVREDRLLFIKNEPEENADFKDISINNNFKFYN